MFQNPDVIESNLADKRVAASRRLIRTVFARMDAVAMAAAMGVTFAVGLFLATGILLLKGASPGMPVGGNLSALGTFLPGYEVNWWGAVLGSLYALAIGSIAGFFLSVLWNFMHVVFIGIAVLRGNWLD